MTRLQQAFAKAKAEQRAAFVGYMCAGDPSLAATPKLVAALEAAGADVVELGMPFSDPTADGPAIQRAAERSLRAGTTLQGLLETVREVRKQSAVPVVVYSYCNPILAYGEERLARDAAVAGVDAFLVVDLPSEEAGPLHALLRDQGVGFVPLVTPTSNPHRVERALRLATDFVYCVSLTGVTGAGSLEVKDVGRRLQALRQQTALPIAVGFGIRSRAQVEQVASMAEGVVVGTAIVEAIERGAGDAIAAALEARELVAGLVAGTRIRPDSDQDSDREARRS